MINLKNKNKESLKEKIQNTSNIVLDKITFGSLISYSLVFRNIIASIIIIGLIIIFFGGIKESIKKLTEDSLSPSLTNTYNENKQNLGDFDKRWEKHLGSFLRNENDPNYFSLASTTEKGLLKFRSTFLERELIIFDFTPLSKDTANIIMHVNNLYEIVIGDNDYKTLTFKARESWNGPWKIILTTKGEDKINMYTGIKRGTDVHARMFGYCQMDGKYLVKLEIKFKPDQIIEGEDQILTPEYIFTPPFQECIPLNISVGLINPNNKSGIEARFLSFEIRK